MKSVVVPLALFALVGGCIPRTATPLERAPLALDEPRIDPDFETLFDEKPVWELRPVTANARDVSASEYIVQPGDTLRLVGEKTGAGSETLARANGLVAPFVIRSGQRLSVPGGRFHKVSAGETGIAIAAAYGTPWADLIELNALGEPFTLRLGQRLLLPPLASLTGVALETRAAAFRLDIDDILTGGEPASDQAAVVPITLPNQPLSPAVPVATPDRFGGQFIWPVTGKIGARFGALGEGNFNQGIEVLVEKSAPIVSASDGVVAFVGNEVANYGGLILIRHGGGWITAYGRAAQANVTRGQKVARGQMIGRAGSGSAPQLFFQMRKNRIPVDPLKQLPTQ